MRIFAKCVGAPEILMADPCPSNKSKDVKNFCNKIGTTLRILEESTQWASGAELYIRKANKFYPYHERLYSNRGFIEILPTTFRKMKSVSRISKII